MKSVDTNVIVRMLMIDDPVQSPIADDIVRQGVFIPLTVLLETAWLLRSRYTLSRRDTADALGVLLDLPDVAVEAREGVEWAVARYAERGDFADLIHLVASAQSDAFLTFDRALLAEAGDGAPLPVEVLAV